MATAAIALPKTRRRPRNAPAAGRASFPEFYFVKQIDNSRLVREIDVERRRECFSLLGIGRSGFSFRAAGRMAAFPVRAVRLSDRTTQGRTGDAGRTESSAPAGPRRRSPTRKGSTRWRGSGSGWSRPSPQQVDSSGRIRSRERRRWIARNWHAISPSVAQILHTSHSYDGPT